MSIPIRVAESNANLPARRKSLLSTMTLTAFLVRAGFLFATRTFDLPPALNHYDFGFETGSIAASLATGGGFHSPFGVPSGPTAWIAPVYPAIVAGAFKVFGLFSTNAAIAILLFNCLCSALTVPVIHRIGRRVFDERAADVAGWIWALVPFFAYWPVTWIWETALSALLCAIVFCYTLELKSMEWQAWAGLGVLWGLIGLTSPSLMGFMPASFLYPAWRLGHSAKTAAARVILAAVFFFAAVAPWLARNEAVFHRPVFLRSNFWFEMSLSNFHTATGEAWGGLHPARNKRALDEYIAKGEVEFVAEAKSRVVAFVKNNPVEFLGLIALRVADFWDGAELKYEPILAIRSWMITLTSALAFSGLIMAVRRKRQWELFGWVLLLYPIPYYLTSTNPRYRHPIEPMLTVLTGFLFVQCWELWKKRRSI